LTHRNLLGGGQTRAEFLERRLRRLVHEGLEGVAAAGVQFGASTPTMGFRGDIAGDAKAADEIANATETEPEPPG
jgi:hypothetical protein